MPLMRLSDRGMLEAKWQPSQHPGRPPRKLYRLTAEGVAYAKEYRGAGHDPKRTSALSTDKIVLGIECPGDASENIDHWSFWIGDDYSGTSARDSLEVCVLRC